MSAASSSGASDQPARAISSFKGAFGYSSRRYNEACSGPTSISASTLLSPVGDALLRQPHHEIQADVVEPGAARLENRLARTIGRMDPAEPAQLRFPERLHAEADAVDARLAKAGHARRRGGFGVGFERDLGVARDVERLAARRHEPGDLRAARAATASRRRRRSCRPRHPPADRISRSSAATYRSFSPDSNSPRLKLQ